MRQRCSCSPPSNSKMKCVKINFPLSNIFCFNVKRNVVLVILALLQYQVSSVSGSDDDKYSPDVSRRYDRVRHEHLQQQQQSPPLAPEQVLAMHRRKNLNASFGGEVQSQTSQSGLSGEKKICLPSYFTCNDGNCIPMRWKCDSKYDCFDRSDEPPECANATKCNEGQFSCTKSHKCIPNNWMCDGEYDCGEGDISDESNCHNAIPKCHSYQSECKNGVCLDISKFCDGHWDCDSDEYNCETEEKLCSAMNCSFNCKLTINGPKCFCPPGQEPIGTQCKDFDECLIEGACDQKCRNTPGSYECICVSGYMRKKNRCIGINVPQNENASLVFVTQHDIQRVSTTGESLGRYLSSDVSAIEIWHRNRTLCAMYSTAWTEISMRCHKIDNLTDNWLMPMPKIITSTNSEFCGICRIVFLKLQVLVTGYKTAIS